MPALTITRFFAALGVVLFHYGSTVITSWTEDVVATSRVSFFFILSGFILVYAARPDDDSRQFWVQRSARLYPVYLLAWCMTGVVVFISSSGTHEYLLKYVAYYGVPALVLTQQWLPQTPKLSWNSPSWTMSVEAFYYLMFPLAYGAIAKLKPRTLLITAVGLLVISMALAVQQLPMPRTPLFQGSDIETTLNSYIGNLPLLQLPKFLLGVALGFIFLKRGPSPAYTWLIVTVAMIGCIEMVGDLMLRNSIMILLYAALIYSLASMRLPNNLIVRTLVLLGQASYAIYILQEPLWRLYWYVIGRSNLIKTPVDIVEFCIVLIVIAVIAHLYFERPAERWIRSKFSKQNSNRAMCEGVLNQNAR